MLADDSSPEIAALRRRAVALAGRPGDLARRASVYHHLYAHSRGNHGFPLLAAHGALWASGWFRAGLRFGGLVAALRGLAGDDRAALVAGLDRFADAFREINRRVCVETFFIYWLTARPELAGEAERIVPVALLAEMERCHAARRARRSLAEAERRVLFTAFFLWEQAAIVGPAVDAAFAGFDWRLIRAMALRPRIRFAYFRGGALAFRDFADPAERIAMGVEAFDRAGRAGWPEVERSLSHYGVMPPAFAADPTRFFHAIARRAQAELAPLAELAFAPA